MGWVSITLPEAGGNIVLNPSAEADGNYAARGATVTRDVTHARFGNRAYKIASSGTNQGNDLTTKAAANVPHYTTFYVWGTITGTMQVCLDGTNWDNAAIVGGATGGFVRYGAAISAARANGSTTTRIRDTANDGNWWLDGVQTEPTNGYFTTYMDGDQDGCAWDGLRHGSKSTRSAQYRLGGRERDLLTDYAITVRQMAGYGLPPIQQNTMPYTLLPGSEFQGDHIGQRTVVLTVGLSDTTIPLLHSKRKKLMNFLYPGAYAGAQEVRLGFKSQHTGRTVYGKFRYVDGLGGQALQAGGSAIEGDVDTKVVLVACDPFFYEDNAESQALTMSQSVTNTAFGAARINGAWQALGSGFNGSVQCVRVDATRGRVWFAGNFTTADGVTVNGLTYWNGTTFVAVGGATKGVAGGANPAIGLVVMPNGDVWVLGGCTSAGGAATRGVARWNNADDTFTVFNLTATAGTFYSGAADSNGNVYFVGNIVGWDGDAAKSYAIKYTAAGAWAALGTVPYSASEQSIGANSISIDANNVVWIVSGKPGADGHLRKWTGTAWVDIGAASAGDGLYSVYAAPNGNVYVGGVFHTIGGVTAEAVAYWNGSTFIPMPGLAYGTISIWDISSDDRGNIIVHGDPVYIIASLSLIWNGYTFAIMDLAACATAGGAQRVLYGNTYAGWPTESGTTSTAAGITTVTPTSTAETKPLVVLTGPTTADTSCTLLWLENQSSDERLYFNLTVLAGETVTIDFENLTVTSDWRGEINDQPLEGSDLAAFALLPNSANTLAAFVTGTLTGATLTAHWPVTHNAIDGGAA